MYKDVLDKKHFQTASKEVIAMTTQIQKEIQFGLTGLGEPKSCKQVIKENIKEFKPLSKLPGFGSPNKKMKELFGMNMKPLNPYDVLDPP